jgi:hypothetical protein
MVKCLGCPALVYFDQNLHARLLERYAKSLNKEVKDLTQKDLDTPEAEGLGSGRPFNIGTEKIHDCPGYDKKEGKWKGRENTVKKEFHGYKYNAYKDTKEPKQQQQQKLVLEKPKPPSPSSKHKEEVIVFSEQSISDTQKRILDEIIIIKSKLALLNEKFSLYMDTR